MITKSYLNGPIARTIIPDGYVPEKPGALTRWRRYIFLQVHKLTFPLQKLTQEERDEQQYWLNVEAETGYRKSL